MPPASTTSVEPDTSVALLTRPKSSSVPPESTGPFAIPPLDTISVPPLLMIVPLAAPPVSTTCEPARKIVAPLA